MKLTSILLVAVAGLALSPPLVAYAGSVTRQEQIDACKDLEKYYPGTRWDEDGCVLGRRDESVRPPPAPAAAVRNELLQGYDALGRGDYATAYRFWRPLADQGDPDAQLVLGMMYAEGNGAAQDYAIAVSWYRKAAEQGNAGAQSRLGSMYFKGQGVTQDDAAAVSWWRQAADQGEPWAQLKLAGAYGLGAGVRADEAMALRLLKSLSNRNDIDSDLRKQVEKSISLFSSDNNVFYLSCSIVMFDKPIIWPITVDPGSGIANGYEAIITKYDIKYTMNSSDADKAIWLKHREKSHERTVTISRISGQITIESEFFGLYGIGNCVKSNSTKF